MRKKILPLLIFVVLLAVAAVYEHTLGDDEYLTVAFLDVGQGDAIYIETPNGAQMLIDGGKGRAVLRQLGRMMPFFDRSIDVVLATHPDEDHIGGLPEVFDRYRIGSYLDPGLNDQSATYETIIHAVQMRHIPYTVARTGMRITLEDGVVLEILFPDRELYGVDANTTSVVARLVYGDTEFLLTGDAPEAVEEYLVALDPASLQSDVLKLGHHGSRTSSSENFLTTVKPALAIISAGKDNSYGHPHKEVTDRLNMLGIPSLTTSNGTVILKSDGHKIWRQ